MENFGGPILRKYAEINQRGKERVRSASFELFNGFPESLQRRFITAMEFSPDSHTVFQDHVARSLEELENSLHMRFALAGRDFPLHSTILEGQSSEVIDTVGDGFTSLQEKAQLAWEGTPINFDYLLLDGGNLLLVAKTIPEPVLAAREQLAELYAEHNLKPLLIQNILHSTAARIMEVPAEFDHETYRTAVTDLRHSISSDPLSLTVDQIIRERSYDYLTRS